MIHHLRSTAIAGGLILSESSDVTGLESGGLDIFPLLDLSPDCMRLYWVGRMLFGSFHCSCVRSLSFSLSTQPTPSTRNVLLSSQFSSPLLSPLSCRKLVANDSYIQYNFCFRISNYSYTLVQCSPVSNE